MLHHPFGVLKQHFLNFSKIGNGIYFLVIMQQWRQYFYHASLPLVIICSLKITESSNSYVYTLICLVKVYYGYRISCVCSLRCKNWLTTTVWALVVQKRRDVNLSTMTSFQFTGSSPPHCKVIICRFLKEQSCSSALSTTLSCSLPHRQMFNVCSLNLINFTTKSKPKTYPWTSCNFQLSSGDCVLSRSVMSSSLHGHGSHQAPSVHGIIPGGVALSSRGSSQSRDRTHISCSSCIGKQVLYHWATKETLSSGKTF